jgi:hypothetical protein
MRKYCTSLSVLLVVLILSACATERTEGLPITLRGAEVPLSGESVMAAIAGEPYRYFRYESVGDALKDKALVSSDGKRIGKKAFLWEGQVHFYHYKDRLVIYVGENPEVIGHIERTFGPQFAGD